MPPASADDGVAGLRPVERPHSSRNGSPGREPCPRKFPGNRGSWREVRFRASCIASRGLTLPESLPNLAVGTGTSPSAAIVALGEIPVLERSPGGGLGMRDGPDASPPDGLEDAAGHQVANVPAGSPLGANVGARVGHPGVMSPTRPRTAASRTSSSSADDQVASVPARRRWGGPRGRFGTRTSPERPRFWAFLEPGVEMIIPLSYVNCASYDRIQAVRVP